MNLSWSSTLIRYILFVFNLLFVITGIVMIAVGVTVKEFYQEYNLFLGNQYFSLPNLLIAIGSLIFFISFFGCCGAFKQSWLMIFIFAILLALIFILEFSAGIAGYVLRDQTRDFLNNSLTDNMKKYKVNNGTDVNFTSNAETRLWDFIQREFECCGVSKPEDWSIFVKEGGLPNSCCTPKPGTALHLTCQLNNFTTATYFKEGCIDGFGDFIKDHAYTLGGVGMGIAVIQLIGVCFACYLTKQLKNNDYST